MNKTWLAIGILIVIGSMGFSEFHSINTKFQVQDDLRKAEERLKNAGAHNLIINYISFFFLETFSIRWRALRGAF